MSNAKPMAPEGSWVGDDEQSIRPFADVHEASEAVAAAERGHADAIETMRRLLVTALRLEQRAEAAETESRRDALTDLLNRRGWRQALRDETERCRRDGRGAVVVAIDVDDFKAYNDAHGHLAGDLLLKRVAATLARASRTNDVLARVGGDEFAVVAVGADNGVAVAERLRQALARDGIAASIGAARVDPSGSLVDAWEIADRAMYQEKAHRHQQAPPA